MISKTFIKAQTVSIILPDLLIESNKYMFTMNQVKKKVIISKLFAKVSVFCILYIWILQTNCLFFYLITSFSFKYKRIFKNKFNVLAYFFRQFFSSVRSNKMFLLLSLTDCNLFSIEGKRKLLFCHQTEKSVTFSVLITVK